MLSILPDWLIELFKSIRETGGKGFLVGGCVRDRLLGFLTKDYDIEVYALPNALLKEMLEKFGKVSIVGEQFAVYKLRPKAAPSVEVDVSLPRRESKYGKGHRGFIIEGDPWMTFEEAVSRRDFTVNAILQDPLTESIIDPLNGLSDLVSKKLRHANLNTFTEDPLRALRAAQLASRYNFSITKTTRELCREINLTDLPKERVYQEIEKILLLSPDPSVGFNYLLRLHVIQKLFPSLLELVSSSIIDNPYSRNSNWDYTMQSLRRGKVITKNLSQPEKLSVLFSILGIRLSLSNLIKLLDALGIQTYQKYPMRHQILTLRKIHILPYKVFCQNLKKEVIISFLRRLERVTSLELLCYLLKSLYLNSSDVFLQWLEESIRDYYSIKKEYKRLVNGNDILSVGIKPGPEVRSLLQQFEELQIEGIIKTPSEAQAILLRLSHEKFSRKRVEKWPDLKI